MSKHGFDDNNHNFRHYFHFPQNPKKKPKKSIRILTSNISRSGIYS